MYEDLTVAALVCVLNEEQKVGHVIKRISTDIVDELIVVDDGSTDASVEIAEGMGATVLSLGRTLGVGAALREGFNYAMGKGYDAVVIVAGNNKDSPEEITTLLAPIAEGRADFVQGSRFLKRNADFGAMPLYRKFATRLHPVLFSIVAGRRVTESTNGFRAISRKILLDPRLDLSQSWLDQYELEPYLYIRTIQLGYRTTEVPVTKVYPPRSIGQTKMKPITGWWSMLRPLVYMGLRLKR